MRRRTFLLLLTLAALSAAPIHAQAQAFHAGVTRWVAHPAGPRNWRGSPTPALRCLLWYPVSVQVQETPQSFAVPGMPALFSAGSAAPDAPPARTPQHLPLLVLSHGLGGSADQFGWLAPALARRGYLVLAVNHPGNNALEPATPEGLLLWGERARDISDALDSLLADPAWGARVDARSIGAVGYSLGGETVLALAGARVDQPAFLDFCLQHPSELTCRLPPLAGAPATAQGVVAAVRASSAASLARSGDSFRDPRIRAGVALAPAAGQAFHANSFVGVSVPLTLLAGTADTLAVPSLNAQQFAAWLPGARLSLLPGVGHYTFLDTCTAEGAELLPQYCTDAPGVDRAAVHQQVTAAVLTFFAHALAPSADRHVAALRPIRSAN